VTKILQNQEALRVSLKDISSTLTKEIHLQAGDLK